MKKPLFTKIIQCVALCLLFITIIPTQILAEGENAYGYSMDASGNKTYYYSVNDAMNATRKNYTVFLTRDWDLSSPLNIVEGTTSRLNLNGYTIKRTDMPSSLSHSGEVITLHPNSKLYVYGSTTDVTFSKYGIKSGGFISGGCTYNGGGIYMKKGSSLYLERVAVVDNYSYNDGGGIYVSDDNCSIELSDAKISYNSTGNKFANGGGVCVEGEKFGMNLAKNSEISHNTTNGLGAGIFCSDSDVTIGSTDETGIIKNNKAVGRAGGIYLNGGTCSVSDLTIDGNSGTDAGGVYCNVSNVYLKNLTIINNKTDDSNGGGVLIGCKDVYLKDCKIYGNHAANYGGGVFVLGHYDVYLRGCNKIYDNTSGKNNGKDDLFLGRSGVYKAYAIGDEFDANSKIGIKTTETGDRLLAKNITGVQYVSSFFLDDSDNYHIGFESQDNEIWQRTGATTYAVKVNDTPVGKYARGVENITAIDNNEDTTKVFVSWDEKSVSSLNLNSEDLTSETITFTMPGEEVNLKSVYAPAVTNVALKMSSVLENQTLPDKAILSWTFNNTYHEEEVNLNWYRKDNGRYVNCATDENATSGTAYVFEVYSEGKQDGVRVISSAITKDNVTINCEGRNIEVNELSINDEGTLNFKSEDIIVGKDVISYVDPIVVSVREGASKQGVLDTINTNLTSIATSKNEYEYKVTLNQVSETSLNNVLFDEDGNIKQDTGNNEYKGFYTANIGITDTNAFDEKGNACEVNLNGIDTTILVINVLPKDEQTSDTKILRINDDDIVMEGDTWYKEITFDGTGYMLDAIPYTDNKVKLIGEKGKRIVHELTVDGYSGKEFYTYILDDSKATTPELIDGERRIEQGVLYQQIIADYNSNNIFAYNPNGDNDWTINKGVSYTVSAEANTYKSVRALAWTVDSNNNMSDISRKTYLLNNYDRNSFNGTFISKVDVTIDNLVYGQDLPSTIKKIDVTLSGNKVDSYENLPIVAWLPNGNGTALNNTVYKAKVELQTADKYTVDYLSSLHVVVNNDERIYAYIENENDKAMLNIIFPELEGSNGGYDEDKALSYTLDSIQVGDYTTSLSYEKAVELNNDLSELDIPYVLLNVKNNNTNEQEVFRIEPSSILKFISSFDSNNSNAQQIILKANLAELIPSYVIYDSIDTNVTLTINVASKNSSANKVVTCEESMGSLNWTWSESKKACVYRVSNTSSK